MDNEVTQANWLKRCVSDQRMTGGMAVEIEEMLNAAREEILSGKTDTLRLNKLIAELEVDMTIGDVSPIDFYDYEFEEATNSTEETQRAWREALDTLPAPPEAAR